MKKNQKPINIGTIVRISTVAMAATATFVQFHEIFGKVIERSIDWILFHMRSM